MTKQDFLSYLPPHTSAILSTVREDGTPDGRGFEFMYEENDRYYFVTANTKDVFKQLQAHPKAAFTYMEPSGKYTVRICGEVRFVSNPEEKQAIYGKIDPMVAKMYKSWDNPIFEYLYFDKPECRLAKGFGTSELVK